MLACAFRVAELLLVHALPTFIYYVPILERGVLHFVA